MVKKQKKPNPIDAAGLGLTQAEVDCFSILLKRQEAGKVSTPADIAKAWKNDDGTPRDRTYVFRVLKRLIDKKQVEQYDTRFYRVKSQPKT